MTKTPRSTTSTRRRIGVVALAVAVVAAACGGDDADEPAADAAVETDAPAATDAPAETDAPDAPAATDDPASVEGPVSTISPDIPEEFLEAIGPVDVAGDKLPPLETDQIDADPALGTAAPTIVGLGFEGEPVRIDAAQDGPTMVIFLAHWCPHCNDEIPVINELRDEGLVPDGVNIVAVSTAANAGRPNFPPAEWLDDMDWTYPAMADGVDLETQSFVVADAYGVTAFPFVTLVDGDGNVAARWAGGRSGDELVQLLTERLV